MANANIRLKKWITEILSNGNYEATAILQKLKDKGYRNIPTMNQLSNVLAKGLNFMVADEIIHLDANGKKYKVVLWGLKNEKSEG